MLGIHDWTMKPFTGNQKTYLDVPVSVPRYWFGEGTGEEIRRLDVTAMGTVRASDIKPGETFPKTNEIVEYGTAIYEGKGLRVAAPFKGEENWRCYGLPIEPEK